MPSLVVTLAALYIIRGIDGVIVNGVTIDPGSMPDVLPGTSATSTILGGALAGDHRRGRRRRPSATRCAPTARARDLYAIGSNPEAAVAGRHPRSERRVFTAFLVSGSLAGFAGALFLALHAQIDVTGGTGYELTVVVAAVGGRRAWPSSAAAVPCSARRLGAVLLNTISQALVSSKVSAFWNDAIAGALLLAAIAFDRWLSACGSTRSLQSAQGAHRDV